MNINFSGFQHTDTGYHADLLSAGEVILIVDDDLLIREPIRVFFEENGLSVKEVTSGQACLDLLRSMPVALLVLDIGLPDMTGQEILAQVREQYPLLAVIMLTGIADLETAMDCIRQGADDFLAKPVRLNEILRSVIKNLEKRRLIIQNRQYQSDLENANFRIQLMHQLSLKMNSVYLNSVELDEILQAILVGITANEGLRFNRAFLAMFDTDNQVLKGRLAIGPGCREEAWRVWSELQQKQLDFFEVVNNVKLCRVGTEDMGLNRLIRGLEIPLSDSKHILIRAAMERRSITVVGGRANGSSFDDMVKFLGTEDFVVVPLFSPHRALGVIIADNYVTRQPISESHVSALELFSSQASLVIEHTHLNMDMQKTIVQLEELNRELDKNKDMLVEAERFSALGHMAAQMLHTLRNPITSIGGVARIMAKKAQDQELAHYADLVYKEAGRLETTLSELFEFVTQDEIHPEPTLFYPLLHNALLLLQGETTKRHIVVEVVFPNPELTVEVDPLMIQKVLVHLIKNAIEAMFDGGHLIIQMIREVDWLKIVIKDTGTGIDDEQLRRAREPFFTTKTYGSGIGLTMVERIVAAHKGQFVIARQEHGTEAVVMLPCPGRP
ncbi:MAG: response regulator [Proteobacteria bacterium]|nr:response regulator [Desulfobulbaceae bacterium]MBU4151712.1 response regulator [Pseudomonadota bacterium]